MSKGLLVVLSLLISQLSWGTPSSSEATFDVKGDDLYETLEFAPFEAIQNPDQSPGWIIGRGIQSKDDQNWIALKCIPKTELKGAPPAGVQDCSALQHIVYNSETRAFSDIGPKIPNDRFIKYRLKKIGKGFRSYLRHTTSRGTVRIVALLTLTAAALFVPMILASGEAPILAEATAGGIQRIGLVMMFGITPALANNPDLGVTNPNKINAPLKDQNGFNWMENPKRMKQKMFSAYRHYVESIMTRHMEIVCYQRVAGSKTYCK